MRLRQFVFVAEQLAPAVDDLVAVLGLEVCYNDPGVGKFGLENALLPLNGNLIEVVAPIEKGTTAGRYLERRGGDGGYMLLLQAADAVAERDRITGLGVRDVWRHDDAACQATHFHPADVPGAILSIDTMNPGEDWHQELAMWKWAGPNWTRAIRTDRVQALSAVEFQARDPAAMAGRWSEVLDRPLASGAGGRLEIALDNARLRFVEDLDGRGVGIRAIDLLPQNRPAILAAATGRGLKISDDQITLCGLQVNLI